MIAALLVGIIVLVIAIIYWRVFLPYGLVVVVVAAIFIFYQHQKDETLWQAAQTEVHTLQKQIDAAQKSATAEGRKWTLNYEMESVAGDVKPWSSDQTDRRLVGRAATITSNDGLCRLSVELQQTGVKRTGLDCPLFNISDSDDLYVKFDAQDVLNKMDLKRDSVTGRVYIPSRQASYSGSGYFDYDDFMLGLNSANTVTIKITYDIASMSQTVWVSFTLDGSTAALEKLGQEKVDTDL